MLHWIASHRATFGWLFGLSLVAFVATLVLIPIVVIRMSPDFFVADRTAVATWRGRHPAIRLAGRIAKNALGTLFLLTGVAMLVLPGQGILTILVGLTLIDFPYKRDLERRVIGCRPISGLINRLRARAGRPPLILPDRPVAERE
ncbi:MAG: PGPGW domain-containing protein [Pirellulales bacterium]